MRHRTLTLATLVLAALALSACSIKFGGDTAASTTTTTEASTRSTLPEPDVAELPDEPLPGPTRGGFELLAAEQACIDDELEGLLPEGAPSPEDATELRPDQRVALGAAMDVCVPGTSLAGFLLAAFAEELGTQPPSAEVEACVADEIDGRTGEIFVSATDGDPTVLFAAMDPCVDEAFIEELLVVALTEGAGATSTQAACIAAILAPEITMSDFAALAAIDEGDPPPAFLADALALAQSECT